MIGGGVSGLGTAALLAQDGWDVELFDQNDTLGGRAGRWSHEGFHFDTGPSWYLMSRVFDHFFALLRTTTAEQLDLVSLDPGYRAWFERGGFLDVPVGVEANAALFESVEAGAGRLVESYLDEARRLCDLAVDHILYSGRDGPAALAVPRLAQAALRLVRLLSQSLEAHVGSRFADPRLRQLLGYPAVFLGTAPSRAPAIYKLMSWMDLAEGVRYPMGGFATLVDSLVGLARARGVRITPGARVTAIRTRAAPGGGAEVEGVEVRDADGSAQTVEADVVVAACDLHHVETRLLPRHLQSYPESWWASRNPGPGAVLGLLGVEGPLPQLMHHNLFLTEDWHRDFATVFDEPRGVPVPASSYVCRPSATDGGAAPEGRENLFVLVPVGAEVAIGRGGTDGRGDAPVEAAMDAAIDQISRWAGVGGLAERVLVRRTIGPGDFSEDLNAWSGGALGPAHVLRQSAFLRPGNTSRRVRGLLYAGSSTRPGIGLPMCLISAELVLKRVRGDRTTGPLPTPST